jgi:tape measure domain-containing protein
MQGIAIAADLGLNLQSALKAVSAFAAQIPKLVLPAITSIGQQIPGIMGGITKYVAQLPTVLAPALATVSQTFSGIFARLPLGLQSAFQLIGRSTPLLVTGLASTAVIAAIPTIIGLLKAGLTAALVPLGVTLGVGFAAAAVRTINAGIQRIRLALPPTTGLILYAESLKILLNQTFGEFVKGIFAGINDEFGFSFSKLGKGLVTGFSNIFKRSLLENVDALKNRVSKVSPVKVDLKVDTKPIDGLKAKVQSIFDNLRGKGLKIDTPDLSGLEKFDKAIANLLKSDTFAAKFKGNIFGLIPPAFNLIVSSARAVDGALKKIGLSLTQVVVGFVTFRATIFLIQQAFQAITNAVGNFIRSIPQATIKLENLRNSLTAIQGETGAKDTLTQLRQVAQDTGQSFDTLSRNYSKYLAVVKDSPLAKTAVKDIETLSKAATLYGLDPQQFDSALSAIGQIASKQKVQAEELQTQLAQNIPGTLDIIARQLNISSAELLGRVEKGTLDYITVLRAFFTGLETETSYGFTQIERGLGFALENLKNQSQILAASIGEAIKPYAIPVIDALSGSLKILEGNVKSIVGVISLFVGKNVIEFALRVILTQVQNLTRSILGVGAASSTTSAASVGAFARLTGAINTARLSVVSFLKSQVGLGAISFVLAGAAAAWFEIGGAVSAADNATKDARESIARAAEVTQRALNPEQLTRDLVSQSKARIQQWREEQGWIVQFFDKLDFGLNEAINGFDLLEAIRSRQVVSEGELIDDANAALSRAIQLQSDIANGADVSGRAIAGQVAELENLRNVLENTNFQEDYAVGLKEDLLKNIERLLPGLKRLRGAGAELSSTYAELNVQLEEFITNQEIAAAEAEAEIAKRVLKGEITQEEAEAQKAQDKVKRAQERLKEIEKVIAGYDAELKKREIEALKEGITNRSKDIKLPTFTDEERKAYNKLRKERAELEKQIAEDSLDIQEENGVKIVKRTRKNYSDALSELDRYNAMALTKQEEAETLRQIEIEKGLQKGTISQEQADKLRLESSQELLKRQIQIEKIRAAEIEKLTDKDIDPTEKDQLLGQSKQKLAELTLQLLQSEQEATQKVSEMQEKASANRLKQIDLQTEALSRQEEAIERINQLAQAGADLAKAYNAAASAQIDSQLARLDRIGELIDAVRPELSDVQQKAIAARQKRAAALELRAQGYNPQRETLAQFELRIARERIALEERSRQLKLEAQKQEQTLALANLQIERKKLEISQKRSQLETEKELAELRRSKIEEQKNLRSAASSEERAAIQESIRLIDQELAATTERLSLLNEEYLQEQAILDLKQQQLRIEQETANQQLQNEQNLARAKERQEYIGKGGRATDLVPRRDYNAQYGRPQTIGDLMQKYPASIPVPPMSDLSRAVEQSNRSVVAKLDSLIAAVNAQKPPQLTQSNQFINQFADANQKELLRKVRSQVAEDVTGIVKGAVNAIAPLKF